MWNVLYDNHMMLSKKYNKNKAKEEIEWKL